LHWAAMQNSVKVVDYLCRRCPELMSMKEQKSNHTPYDIAKSKNAHLSIEIFEKMVSDSEGENASSNNDENASSSSKSKSPKRTIDKSKSKAPDRKSVPSNKGKREEVSDSEDENASSNNDDNPSSSSKSKSPKRTIDKSKSKPPDRKSVPSTKGKRGESQETEIDPNKVKILERYDQEEKKFDYVRKLMDKEEEKVKILCAERPLHEVRHSSGRSLLHIAAYQNRLSLVEVMLSHGFDASLVDKNGISALHWAAERDWAVVVNYLCRRFPELMSIKNKSDLTPYDVAKSKNAQRSIEVFEKIFAERK